MGDNTELIEKLYGKHFDCNCGARSPGECGCDTSWPENYTVHAAEALELIGDLPLSHMSCEIAQQAISLTTADHEAVIRQHDALVWERATCRLLKDAPTKEGAVRP